MKDGLFTPDEEEEDAAKYPIYHQGDDFQPDAMPDFDDRMNSGEFANKKIEEIRQIYVDEELEDVNQREIDEQHRQMDEQEQRDLDRQLDGDDD